MAWKSLIGAVFLCNVLIGNICLIGTAHAAPATAKTSDMVMSRHTPAKCPWISQSTGPLNVGQPEKESPCATGHCFAQPDPHAQDNAIALRELPVPVLPAVPCNALFPSVSQEYRLRRSGPAPPLHLDVSTVVLRR